MNLKEAGSDEDHESRGGLRSVKSRAVDEPYIPGAALLPVDKQHA
jgi:hypothetical protein